MRIKRGQRFAYTGTFPILDETGHQADLTGWTGAAELRRRNASADLVERMTFEWRDPVAGVFALWSADTGSWPLETLDFDIVVTSPDGHKIPTSSIVITVEREVTRG